MLDLIIFCDFIRCGHCKSLAPVSEYDLLFSCYHLSLNFCWSNNRKLSHAFLSLQTYEKVATVFKLEENVVIANLDADKHRDLAEK